MDRGLGNGLHDTTLAIFITSYLQDADLFLGLFDGFHRKFEKTLRTQHPRESERRDDQVHEGTPSDFNFIQFYSFSV